MVISSPGITSQHGAVKRAGIAEALLAPVRMDASLRAPHEDISCLVILRIEWC
ncbi:MAG: hypothetical protein F7C33_07145 [Desulfurococcales archaeon]|nr:hypothetical protein [Desulfurococcales archaeon]